MTEVLCSLDGTVDCTAYGASVPMSGAVITIKGTFPAVAADHTSVTVGAAGAGVDTTCALVGAASSAVTTGTITCTAPSRAFALDTDEVITVTVAGQVVAVTDPALKLTYSECLAGP